MKKLYAVAGVIFLCAFTTIELTAQTVGIGTDYPSATLDVHGNAVRTTINVDRQLGAGVSAAGLSAVLITDENSDGSALEVLQNDPSNTAAMIWTLNSGLWTGLSVGNVNPATIGPSAFLFQAGDAPVMAAQQTGVGDGLDVYMNNAANVEDGMQITHEGNGFGVFIDAQNATLAMLNLIESGGGIANVHTADNTISLDVDMDGLEGTGYRFSNYDATLTPNGGDGFGTQVFISTQTATVGSNIQGAAFGSNQYGIGPGVFMDHYGTEGHGLEVKTRGNTNIDPTVYAASLADNPTTGVDVIYGAYTGTGTTYDHTGVYGESVQDASGFGYGVYGQGGYIGVVGSEGSAGAIAGVYALGDVGASGAKPFIIDHPLDPENKMLKHFALESNEVLNVYRGTVRLNNSGRKRVSLPDYFHSININFSYQLTPIGTQKQPWIVKEVRNGSFVIGGAAGSKVSWTIFANRNDAYVQANPDNFINTQDKRPQDRGKFLDPVSHNMDASKGIFYKPPASERPVHSMANDAPGQEAARTRLEEKRAASNDLYDELERKNTERANRQSAPTETRIIRKEIKTWDEVIGNP